MTESPVTFFIPDNPQMTRNLRAKLIEARAKRVEELVSAGDWSDFKEKLGVIRGLEMAAQICAETEQDLYGRH